MYFITATAQNSIRYYEAMMEYGVQGELHIYQSGGHGYGLERTAGTESIWPKACEDWMIMNGFIPFTTD